MDFTDEERRTGYREGFRRLENSSRDFMWDQEDGELQLRIKSGQASTSLIYVT